MTVGARETRASRAQSFVEGARLETYLQCQTQKGIAPRGPALLRVHLAAVEPFADAAREEAARDRRKRLRRQNDLGAQVGETLRRLAGALQSWGWPEPGGGAREAVSVIEAAEALKTPQPGRSFFCSSLARKNASGATVRGPVFAPAGRSGKQALALLSLVKRCPVSGRETWTVF